MVTTRSGTKTDPGGRGRGKGGGMQDVKKTYLFLYNVGSALAWLFVLERVVRHMTSHTSSFSLMPSYFRSEWSNLVTKATTMDADIGMAVRFIQTAALLEVLHVALGLVRSSPSTTLMQVSSRLFLVWGVCWFFPGAANSPFYATMVFAWSLTEVIRYPYYAAGLVDVKLQWLEWLRYSLFYVLYPLGALSEAAVMYASAQYVRAGYGDLGALVMGVLIIGWPAGLYVMLGHMHSQRKKYLGGGKGKKRA